MSEEMTTTTQGGALMRPVVTAQAMMEAHQQLAEFIGTALIHGVDYGVIPGTDRPALKKPGSEKITTWFGCYPRFTVLESEVDHNRAVEWVKRKKKKWKDGQFDGWEEERGSSVGLYRYVTRCEIVNRATGQVVADAIGVASTMEGRYVDRPRECENTVAKMSAKRAMVGAVLTGFALSGIFCPDDENAETDRDEKPRGSGKGKPQSKGKAAAKKATAEQLARLAELAADDRVPDETRVWIADQLKQGAPIAADQAAKWNSGIEKRLPAQREAEPPAGLEDGEPEYDQDEEREQSEED